MCGTKRSRNWTQVSPSPTIDPIRLAVGAEEGRISGAVEARLEARSRVPCPKQW